MQKLLIVDESEDIREHVKASFSGEYSLLTASTAADALALYQRHRPKVVVLDLGLQPYRDSAEGFRCLSAMLAVNPSAKIIVAAGNAEIDSALKAVQCGAYDFLRKPVDPAPLKMIVRRAFHLRGLEEENRKLRCALDKKSGSLSGVIGECPAMVEVLSTIRKVAASDVAVLVQGESGTGKELVAKAVHAASPRRDAEFAAVNCGAIPENLLESELFGHEHGAFTGARSKVEGKAEHARGGTLFLDEIGELPAPLQVKLLRFLQDKRLQRVGGREEIEVNTRIIAATNRVLPDAIRSGRFREDLYYRIGVVTIQLPPLRERKEDISVLAALFLSRCNEEFKKRIKGFSAAALTFMESYAWPGNVRELENKIQRAVILSEGPLIELHDLGFSARPVPATVAAPATTLKDARDRLERQMIRQAMDRRKGNIVQAAEDLGISRPTFYDMMKKHGLFHISHQQAIVEGR